MDKIFLAILLTSLASVCSSQQLGIGGQLVGRRRPDLDTCPAPRLVRPRGCFSQCSPNPRPRRLGGLPGCPKNEQCCRNRCGAFVCTRTIPAWCPQGSPFMRCRRSPCDRLTCPRFPRANCKPTDPCEPYCTGAYFIRGMQIPDWYCNYRPRPRAFAFAGQQPVQVAQVAGPLSAPDTPDI